MSVLYLTEDDVKQVLTMDLAIEAVEAGLRKMALEEAFNNPRSRCQTDHTMLHLLPASAKTMGVLGFKAYTTTRNGPPRFHVTLYDGKSGEMIALMQADFLGRMRTGAASAIAAKYLARPESSSVGLLGTGGQARTQLLGLAKMLTIKTAFIWSRTEKNRDKFVKEMNALLPFETQPATSSEAAVRDRDIVVTATSTQEPILKGAWLSPGQHLNIVGSNFMAKSEIDVDVVRRANFICIDSKDQGKIEAGDFRAALDERLIEWYDIQELSRVVAHRTVGRTSPLDITLFKSLGIGLEDIAVGAKVLEKAKEAGLGKRLDL